MSDTTLEDHKPRDIGTALASCIGICFISMICYSALFQTKDEFEQLHQAHWSEITLTPQQFMSWHTLEFRTGDISLYIDQYQQQIYEQRCEGFKKFCESIAENKVKPTAFYFYSNTPELYAQSARYLKAIEFTDEYDQTQTLTVMPFAPNDPQYIQQRKQNFLTSLLGKFVIFSIFSMLFYINHLGRYSSNLALIKKINITILIYYFGTVIFFITQYLLL